MAVTTPTTDRANRDKVWFWLPIVVFVLTLAAVLAKVGISWYRNHPHGDPDPGGARVAFLTDAAHRAIPPGSDAVRVRVVNSAWERGGCDGAPPGWSSMKVVEKFHTQQNTSAGIDAAMAGQGWRSMPPGDGTAERGYEPADRRCEAEAFLSSFPGADGTMLWTLWLVAPPAENATNSC